MKKVITLFAMAFASSSYAQQGAQQPVPAPIPVKASDLSAPIPIIRGVVDGVVKEQQAYILTKEQIEALKESSSEARRANVSPYPHGVIAKPVMRSITEDDDSSSVTRSPRIIRLSQGTITSLVFGDMNGNPWLVKSVSFDCALFTDGVTCPDSGGQKPPPTNTVKIAARQPYSYGNIVIELEDRGAPLTYMLATGQSDENDVSVRVRVSGRNPNAKPQAIALENMPEHDGAMGYFLDGVAPQGAVKLSVTGGNADAWILNGALYVRTRLSILSPAFTNRVGNSDGLSVFKYRAVVPQLLASINGKPTTLFVSGY